VKGERLLRKLEGKVVVITGSTRGIGKAIAEACGKAGAKLVICSRNNLKVKKVLKHFKEKGYSVTGISTDVSKIEDLNQLFNHSLKTWGQIDVWINNAGISSGYRHLEQISSEEIKRIVDINLTATLQACRIIIPYFKDQGKGILINMSGRGGDGDHSPYMVPYTATKSAITTLTKSLSEENINFPISINSVVPGMVETDFYKDVKTDSEGKQELESLPYVLNAFGVPLKTVGKFFVELASQQPGKETGNNYSLLKGFRLIRGITLITWYKITGKI
jgi:short-subunit dehydrogenase